MNNQHTGRRRGIYILPNLFTTAALFCGFYAILAATDGRYVFASVLIFFAMILDGCDGRVARLTNTASEFGVQYDSLADLVSFGVAPAMLLYHWTLHLSATAPLVPSRLGWMAAFIYTACAALRLARFNAQVNVVDKAFFIGLPSPSAAGVIAGFVWFAQRYGFQPKNLLLFSAALLILAGLAMVSNFKYFSGKSLKIEGKLPFRYAALPAIILAGIFLEPALALPLIFFTYALHGPLWSIWRWQRKRSM